MWCSTLASAGAPARPLIAVTALTSLTPSRRPSPGGSARQLAPTPADQALAQRLYSYGVVPLKEKLPLNLGPDTGVGPTISPPTRSQSGSRSALQIHICRSPVNNGGPGADGHRKLPARPCNSTWGTKK